MTKLSKGDKGITNTLTKKNVRKSSDIIKTLAFLDEAVCFTGLLRTKIRPYTLNKNLENIQLNIMSASAVLAGDKNSLKDLKESTENLTKIISQLEARLPKRHSFIVPGKNEQECLFNIVRTKIRTAETYCASTKCSPVVKQFLNKASKYIYLLGIKV